MVVALMVDEIASLLAAVTPGLPALTESTLWRGKTMATVIRSVTLAGVFMMEMTACPLQTIALKSNWIFLFACMYLSNCLLVGRFSLYMNKALLTEQAGGRKGGREANETKMNPNIANGSENIGINKSVTVSIGGRVKINITVG